MGKKIILVCVIAALAIPLTGLGQQVPGGGGMGGYAAQQPAAYSAASQVDLLRDQVNFTDVQWAAARPKLQRVLDLRSLAVRQPTNSIGRNVAGGFGGGYGNTGYGMNQPADASDPISLAKSELDVTLLAYDSTLTQIARKLSALRMARAKAAADLQTAENDLKKILTLQQEATLAYIGVID